MCFSILKEKDTSNQRPRSEFTDVDHAQRPDDYVHMLDAQRSMPFEMIRPVAHYIEGMKLAQSCGVVTEEVAEQWIFSLEEAMRTGRFFHAIMWFLTSARKPD